MSLRLRLLAGASRLVLKPMVAHAADPRPLRALFEWVAPRVFRPPPFTLIRDTVLAPGLRALVVSNRPGSRPPRPGKVVLYFHGGAFMAGSPRTHAGMLARIARMTRAEVVAPIYRLAPEHPFPAAADDARAAFDGLVNRGHAASDIVLGGDSAGGNLALGLTARLCAEGRPPAGLFAFSPVTDLTFSGASIAENAGRDPMLPASRRDDLLRLYLAGADPSDPRASPLFAKFPDPPPVFLQVSETEILRDDSTRLADRLRAAGGAVTLDLWPDAPHVWVIFERYLPEAREGLRRVAGFVNRLFDEDQASPPTASR